MYCGDDVSSVVFDIGSYNVRAGYSGEDVPRSVLPSYVGVLEQDDDARMQTGEEEVNKENKFVIGQTEVSHRRDNMDIAQIYNDDGSLRFDILDEFIERALVK